MTFPDTTRSTLPRTHASVHRIDTDGLRAPISMAPGHVEQRQCRPGYCEGLPTCKDVHCEGHPVNEVQPHERNAQATRRFWLTYIAGLAAFAAFVIPNADRIVGLFTR